jgi:hypothetical protein
MFLKLLRAPAALATLLQASAVALADYQTRHPAAGFTHGQEATTLHFWRADRSAW